MVSPLIAQIGLPILARALGEALQDINHPAARGAATALGDLDLVLTQGQISPEQIMEANRHTEKIATLQAEQMQTNLAETNKSLRAEIASGDIFVRRMRPTFGYIMATTWAAQMFGLAYVIVFRTSEAHLVIEAMESLGMIWGIGLSVLGIYVYKRSEEKRIDARKPRLRRKLPAADKQNLNE